MATDIERLVVSLEARINQFDKAMARANGIANQNAKKIENRFDKLSNNLNAKLAGIGKNAFGGFVSGLAAPIAGLLSMQAAVNGAKVALDQFGQIADDSLAAGLDAEFFQAIAYQAGLGGVAIDQVSAALATFNKNAGLAAEGKGRMVAALKALDPELLKNIQLATDQETRIKLVADALAQQTDASTRAAIATAAFGDAGLKLAGVFAGGAAQIEEMAAKAKELGLIVDRELIARADELGDQFETTSRIIDLKIKTALVNLGPVLVGLSGLAADFGNSLAIVFDQFQAVENRQFLRPLQNQLAGLYNEMAPIKDRIVEIGKELERSNSNKFVLNIDLQDAKAQLASFEAQALAIQERIAQLLGKPAGPPVATPTPPASDPNAGMLGRGGPGRIKPAEPFYDPNEKPKRGGGGAGARNTEADAAVRQAEAVADLIANLQFEQSLIGKSALEQEVLTTLRRADVDATSEQGLAIRALIEDIDAQKLAQDAVNQALEDQADLAQQAGAALAKAFEDGKVTGTELLGILADIAKQMVLTNLTRLNDSGGGNIFTNLLSGVLSGFATGTSNTGGKRGEVRGLVHGQEAVIPLPSGGKVPVQLRLPPAQTNGGQGVGAAQAVRVDVAVSVDDDGKLQVVAQRAGAAAASVVVNNRVPRMISDQAPSAVAAANLRKHT